MGVATCLRWEPWGRMANLTSTHRHDYRWPHKNCLVPKAEAPNGHCTTYSGASGNESQGLPLCGQDRPYQSAYKDPVPQVKDPQWSQQGLLVEKISPRASTTPAQLKLPEPQCLVQRCEGDVVPARVGAPHQQDTSRYDQPNQYLQKLCDKFPQPFAVITATPRDELVRRIYADRYRTTYQNDYCTNATDTIRKIKECGGSLQNAEPGHLQVNNTVPIKRCKCGCGCQMSQRDRGDGAEPSTSQIRPLACRPAAVSKNFHFSCCTPKKTISSKTEEVGPPEKIPPWASEYVDGIGRTAHIIMEQKLLYPKKKK